MYQPVINGMPHSRAAINPLQAAARPRAWIAAHRRSRASRAKMKALRNITTGLLLETSTGTNSPPAVATSATRRPARDTTVARWPAPERILTSSTAPASAAPPSSVGTTMSTAIGTLAPEGTRNASSERMLSKLTAGRLDISSSSKYRRFSSACGERFDAPHANSRYRRRECCRQRLPLH